MGWILALLVAFGTSTGEAPAPGGDAPPVTQSQEEELRAHIIEIGDELRTHIIEIGEN
jgi:hypothetical protein